MIRKYLQTFLVAIALFSAGGMALSSSPVSADVNLLNPSLGKGQRVVDCSGAASASAACTEQGTTEDPVSKTIKNIVNIVSIVAGMAAVIVIIVSGIKYMTADGDSAKIGSAKSTLINVLIGLVVLSLARVIIIYVVNRL